MLWEAIFDIATGSNPISRLRSALMLVDNILSNTNPQEDFAWFGNAGEFMQIWVFLTVITESECMPHAMLTNAEDLVSALSKDSSAGTSWNAATTMTVQTLTSSAFHRTSLSQSEEDMVGSLLTNFTEQDDFARVGSASLTSTSLATTSTYPPICANMGAVGSASLTTIDLDHNGELDMAISTPSSTSSELPPDMEPVFTPASSHVATFKPMPGANEMQVDEPHQVFQGDKMQPAEVAGVPGVCALEQAASLKMSNFSSNIAPTQSDRNADPDVRMHVSPPPKPAPAVGSEKEEKVFRLGRVKTNSSKLTTMIPEGRSKHKPRILLHEQGSAKNPIDLTQLCLDDCIREVIDLTNFIVCSYKSFSESFPRSYCLILFLGRVSYQSP